MLRAMLCARSPPARIREAAWHARTREHTGTQRASMRTQRLWGCAGLTLRRQRS